MAGIHAMIQNRVFVSFTAMLEMQSKGRWGLM